MSATDAFAEVIQSAVKSAVKEALNLSEVTNRRLMQTSEAATYLGVSKRTVFEMIANHAFPAIHHGRKTLIDIRDLDQWIDQNKGHD